MTRTPLTYDAPTERRDRAASHWCEPLGSRVYCSRVDCPHCSDDDVEDGGQS